MLDFMSKGKNMSNGLRFDEINNVPHSNFKFQIQLKSFPRRITGSCLRVYECINFCL